MRGEDASHATLLLLEAVLSKRFTRRAAGSGVMLSDSSSADQEVILKDILQE